MSSGEITRANISAAIASLQKDDAETYKNLWLVFCNTNAGGHPNQSQHLTAANRLTRELIEIGAMPASALRDDATITLT